MPFAHGKNGVLYVGDSGGTCRLVSPDLNNISLSWTRDNPTTTTYQVDTQQRVSGVRDYTLTGAGLWSSSANVSAASVLAELLSASIISSFQWAPNGSISGCMKFSGCVLISQCDFQGPQNAPTGISFTFQAARGDLTASTV